MIFLKAQYPAQLRNWFSLGRFWRFQAVQKSIWIFLWHLAYYHIWPRKTYIIQGNDNGPLQLNKACYWFLPLMLSSVDFESSWRVKWEEWILISLEISIHSSVSFDGRSWIRSKKFRMKIPTFLQNLKHLLEDTSCSRWNLDQLLLLHVLHQMSWNGFTAIYIQGTRYRQLQMQSPKHTPFKITHQV